MIDIHSHILPAMDDGSQSISESLEMLRLSRQQGITQIFATPHFSAVKENPKSFLSRRQASAAQLDLDSEMMPQLGLGAEVAYFSGMSHCKELPDLCLEGTDLLLVEMPFAPWTDRIVSDVCAIRQQLGLIPVLAHVERYSRGSQMGRYRDLLLQETLFQCNAEYFLRLGTKAKAMRQLRRGEIHLLGSDAHNLSSRAPKLGEAATLIRQKLGEEVLTRLAEPLTEYKR